MESVFIAIRPLSYTFTKQTTGTFTFKFYVRTSAAGSGGLFVFLSETDNASDVVRVRTDSSDIDYEDSGGWDKIVDDAGATWYGIKITLNMGANTFDVDLDSNNDGTFDTSVSSAQAFTNNNDPDRVYINVGNDKAISSHVDDLCIEN